MNANPLPLKDFHLPPEPGLWPLAPGWWILCALGILIVLLCLFLLRRHRRKVQRDYRREAKTLLNQRIADYELDGDQQALSMHVNRLLKRVALNAISPSAARLTDSEWVAFLVRQLDKDPATMDEVTIRFLTQQPYSPLPLLGSSEIERALSEVIFWIENHQGELLNAHL